MRKRDESPYGVLAEFRTADELVHACRAAREAGYTRVEAYSPFPVEGLAETLGFERNNVPKATLIGGIVGGLATYLMQWYAAVVSYPINVGGRPLHSWPSFVPATFEITILGAALAAVATMLVANGLPRLHHPLFSARQFNLSTRNRFFICVRPAEERFDREAVHAWLRGFQPIEICDVPA